MKIYLDTAITEEIKKGAETGIIDGVTTNPSLIKKSGRDFKEVINEITDILPDGDVSAEVVSEDFEGMMKEAKEYASWKPNIVIKVPLTREGIRTTAALAKEGIRVNQTLVFSPSQALLAAKAGAKFISPFVGRVDDISGDGMELIAQIRTILDNYTYDSEIIVASIRHPKHFVDSALIGGDIATVPYPVFEQLFKHPLTDIGLKKFLKDAGVK